MGGSFIPRPWARNPHIQTILGSFKTRSKIHYRTLVETSREMIIDGGGGVRLLGYYSPQPSQHSRGLITLLHGWEGSSQSNYIMNAGTFLYREGYDVFRLNLRDHGDSHHLNVGLFHGALIDETFNAVRNISLLRENDPYFLIGYSLGGNFALRIARMQSTRKIKNLRHVICVSPALDPHKATLAIDSSLPIYRHYFLSKWKASLRKKQSLFPGTYHFIDILHEKTCMSLTEAIMPYHPDFDDYREYFKRYTLLNDALADLSLPVTIITSEDDPIVTVNDFRGLKKNSFLEISIQRYGGHCGFIDFPPLECWYLKEFLKIFKHSHRIEREAHGIPIPER